MVSQRRHIMLAFATALAVAISALAAPVTSISTSRDRGYQTSPQNLDSENALTQDSAQASTRLMRELIETYKCDSYKKGIFQVELRDDNLYEWDVKLLFSGPEHKIHEDLDRLRQQGKRDYVLLRITFPQNYPSEPPFVRNVYPVMQGSPNGALCMYLLSPQGWIPDCTVEALVLSIVDHMFDSEPRVDFRACSSEYSDGLSDEMRAFYAKRHGWHMPRPRDQAWYDGPNM